MKSLDPPAFAERRVLEDRRRNRRDAETVLDTREACRYLRISRPTFLKLVAAGRIRARKVGRGWRVLRSELERFLLCPER